MTTVISDRSAYDFWRSEHRIALCRPKRLIARSLPPAPCVAELEALDRNFLFIPDGALNVLISMDIQRRSSASTVFHTCALPLPRRSLVRVDDDVLVVSPELCFVQMAHTLSFVDLVKFGLELCATYVVSEDTSKNLRPREAVTTVPRLKAFIDSAQGMRGVVNARRALRYIAEGSASPMENNLFMLLRLPCMLGGYGMPAPEFNHRIDVTARARTLASKPFYKCDLYWPKAKVAAEYESDEWHTGAENVAKDSIRRNALEAMGITVVTVTTRQLYSMSEMDKVADILARHIGARLRNRRYGESRELRRLLLGNSCR